MIQKIFYCLVCMMMAHSVFAFKEKPKKITLSNGLKVYLLHDKTLPYLSVNLITPLGSSTDPNSKEGLSYIASQSLSRGTTTKTAQDISKELEQLGSRFFAATSKDYTIFSSDTLSWNTEKLLKLFSDILLHPRFSSKEIDFVKNQTQSRIKKQPESSGSFAGSVFSRILFENSPYQHSSVGYTKTIGSIQSTDVRQHYKKYFLPEESVLGVTGRYPKNIKSILEKYFAEWKPNKKKSFFSDWFKKPPTPFLSRNTNQKDRYIVVHDEDQVQSNIRIGFVSIPRSAKDFLAFQVANIVLGGGMFSARLMDEIREKLGYTYGIRSSLNPLKYSGIYGIATATRPDVTGKTVTKSKELLKEFHEKGITQEELKNAKEYYRVGLMRSLEKPESRLARRMLLEYMGVPYDFNNLKRKLNQLSLNHVQKIIKKYFSPSGLTIVIFTDYEKVKHQFKNLEKLPADKFL